MNSWDTKLGYDTVEVFRHYIPKISDSLSKIADYLETIDRLDEIKSANKLKEEKCEDE